MGQNLGSDTRASIKWHSSLQMVDERFHIAKREAENVHFITWFKLHKKFYVLLLKMALEFAEM